MSNSTTTVVAPAKVTELIQSTPGNQIAELEFVKNKFIQNYNACNRDGMGELIYARNLAHFKQALNAMPDLANADRFSIYACLMTIAVNGYSVDPADNEIYLIPRGGKMCIQKQAPAHIKRLQRTEQIAYAEQAILVYEGDDYEVSRGKVLKHVEKLKSDKIIAGYIIFHLTDNIERHITYRQSDWESWRSHSPQKDGGNWVHGPLKQPKPGFLKTKIVSHACNEKCWASGRTPATVEVFETVEIDEDDDFDSAPKAYAAAQIPKSHVPPITEHETLPPAASPAASPAPAGVTYEDENF